MEQSNNLNNNETVQKNEEYSTKKFKKIDILIFIVCILIAFFCWCYAHYVNDPIVEKELTLNFVLEGGESYEELSQDSITVTIYGISSKIADLNEVDIAINRSLFNSYDADTMITIEHDDDYHCYTTEVSLKLIRSSND